MKRTPFSVLALLLVIITVGTVDAQDQQSDEGSLLPEIDPQDIEIRSQFKARFPGLRRQPILGFDPSPRVYQVDPNRMPFMETPEEVVANLPVSMLSRPEAPNYIPLQYSSEINAFGRAGVGSYVSPEVQLWGVSRLNKKSYVGGDLDFNSSDGHLDSQQSSFRFFNANGEFATKIGSRSRVDAQIGLENSFNHMPNLTATPDLDSAWKKYGGFNLAAGFEHHKNSVSGWKVQAGTRYHKVELEEAGTISAGIDKELVFNGSVTKRWAGSRVNETFTIGLGGRGGSYDNNAGSGDWVTAHASVIYERLFNYSTQVRANARVYYGSDSFDDQVYIGPSIEISHPFLDILTVTAKAGAKPYLKTIEELHAGNRFLSVNNGLRHSYTIFGSAEAMLEYSDIGSLNFGVRYENTAKYPVYNREDVGRTNIDGTTLYEFYTVDYRDAYTLKAYVGATHQVVPEKFWIDAKFYLQSPNLQDGGRLPYEEKVGFNTALHLRVFDKLSVEGWADFVGSRETLQTSEKLDSYLVMGGQADFQITENFGAYVKLVNLLNQDYEVWQGYTERPFQAFGGITIKL